MPYANEQKQKRFRINFELELTDRHGGSMFGSSTRPSFRIETDEMDSEIIRSIQMKVIKMTADGLLALNAMSRDIDELKAKEAKVAEPAF